MLRSFIKWKQNIVLQRVQFLTLTIQLKMPVSENPEYLNIEFF